MDSMYQEMAEPEKYWNLDDFKEHVRKELNWSRIGLDGIQQDGHPISYTDWCGLRGPYNWIFWSREHDDPDPLMTLPAYNWGLTTNNPTLKDKVRLALRKILLHTRYMGILFQFWAATTTSDGRTLLTTQGQPFALNVFSNDRLCEYRMICKDYTFYLDGMNGEEELGIPGRVYLNKCPEYTPNVEFYSVKEYPQRDHALRCGVSESCNLPVIEQSSQICVGVLEIVGIPWLLYSLERHVYSSFQGLGLECFASCKHYEMQEKSDNKAHKHAFMEMKRVLKLVCKIYKLRSTLMWVWCETCTTILPVKDLCNGWLSWIHSMNFSMDRCLRNKIGVLGRALSSLNLLYCSDVTQLSMVEYPFAHLARDYNLRGYFIITLRNSYTGNDVYVLEIFLPTGNKDEEDSLTSLSKILETMNKKFKTFRLACGEVPGKELSVEVIEFQNGQKRHYVQTLQVTGSLPSLEPLQNGGERMQLAHRHSNVSVGCMASLGGHLANVDKVRPPRPSRVDHQEEVPQLNSNLPSNQASASIAHTQPHGTVMQNANTVNVKAKYVKGLTVLFPLSLSSTLEELIECIETRLHLSRSTYHVCYIDGDNDKITITCDQDFQFWLYNSPRSPGNNAVVLHIDPIS